MKSFNVLCFFIFVSISFSSCAKDENVFSKQFLQNDANEITTLIRLSASFPVMREYSKHEPNGIGALQSYYKISNPSIFDDFSILIPEEDYYSEIAVFIYNNPQAELEALNAVNERYNNLNLQFELYNKKEDAEFFEKTILKYENAIIFILSNQKNEIINTIDKLSEPVV